MLRALEPEATVDVATRRTARLALPAGAALARLRRPASGPARASRCATPATAAGAAPARARARAASTPALPSFGSCFAAQLVAVAAGGSVRANPKGREFGLARKIELSAAGRAHPLFAGKPAVFDAYTSHGDEVDTLPPGRARCSPRTPGRACRRSPSDAGAAQLLGGAVPPGVRPARDRAARPRPRPGARRAGHLPRRRRRRPPGRRRSRPSPTTRSGATSPGASRVDRDVLDPALRRREVAQLDRAGGEAARCTAGYLPAAPSRRSRPMTTLTPRIWSSTRRSSA